MEKTMLVVDDDKLITMTMKTMVDALLGYKVITCNNPEEALKIPELVERKVQVIVSDFMMPEMNGLQFLRAAKEICPDASRILLTGYADKENAIACINEVGLYYYMQKPWDNTDLINIIRNAFERTELFDELKKKNEELSVLNRELEMRVNNRVAAVRNLLNNAGQGFMTIGSDLMVQPEYSEECVRIFNEKIEGKKFSEIIYQSEPDKQEFVMSLLGKIFEEDDELKMDAYLSLLPDSFNIGERIISLAFKLVNDPENQSACIIMAILTDITEKIFLQNQVEQERKNLKMVVSAVVDADNFFGNIEEYNKFASTKIKELFESSESAEKVYGTLFNSIHTFKGIFGLFDMHHATKTLHDLETDLVKLKKRNPGFTKVQLKELIDRFELENAVEADTNVLREILGENYLINERGVEGKRKGMAALEKRIAQLPESNEKESLVSEMQRMTYVPFLHLVKVYEDYTMKAADKAEKLIKRFNIEGANVMVDYSLFVSFTRSLVHIFRNIVEHGIELPDERIEKGKSETGKVRFQVWEENNNLLIEISDDGRGLDLAKIKEKAIQKNILTKEKADALSHEETIDLIFSQDFSTRDEANEIAGRGFGLSSVRDEVKKINGSVKVNFEENNGTSFKFTIPVKRQAEG